MCALVRGLGKWAWLPAVLLYLVGLLGDSWYGLTAALPPLRAAYEGMFLCFDYTRNGLFSAPIFLLLGGRLARPPPAAPAAGLLWGRPAAPLHGPADGGGPAGQGAVTCPGSTPSTSPSPCAWAFCSCGWPPWRCPPLPALRGWTAAVYVLHPWCIVLVRGGARVAGLTGLLVDNSLGHYAAVALLSALLALPFALRRPAQADRPGARAWAEVDAAALRHNLAALSALLPAGGRRSCRW